MFLIVNPKTNGIEQFYQENKHSLTVTKVNFVVEHILTGAKTKYPKSDWTLIQDGDFIKGLTQYGSYVALLQDEEFYVLEKEYDTFTDALEDKFTAQNKLYNSKAFYMFATTVEKVSL